MRLQVHDELASTQDECARRAALGAPDGFAVLARRQVRARGSHGRRWESLDGNLFLSVLIRDAGLLAEIGWVPLLCGVAAAEALLPFVPETGRLRLKWPNDLMLDGAKLGGVLVEGVASGLNADALVAGFGINVAAAPTLADRRTAALADAGVAPPDPVALAGALLERVAARRAMPRAAVIPAWEAWGPARGAVLEVTVAGQRWRGAYEGLTPRGHLRLLTETGPKVFAAGEVATAGAPDGRTPRP